MEEEHSFVYGVVEGEWGPVTFVSVVVGDTVSNDSRDLMVDLDRKYLFACDCAFPQLRFVFTTRLKIGSFEHTFLSLVSRRPPLVPPPPHNRHASKYIFLVFNWYPNKIHGTIQMGSGTNMISLILRDNT